jgi:hypothetical protein
MAELTVIAAISKRNENLLKVRVRRLIGDREVNGKRLQKSKPHDLEKFNAWCQPLCRQAELSEVGEGYIRAFVDGMQDMCTLVENVKRV